LGEMCKNGWADRDDFWTRQHSIMATLRYRRWSASSKIILSGVPAIMRALYGGRVLTRILNRPQTTRSARPISVRFMWHFKPIKIVNTYDKGSLLCKMVAGRTCVAYLITFRVRCSRVEMYIGHARLCVCVFVARRIPTLLHGPGCKLGKW